MVLMITYNYNYLPCIPVVQGITVTMLRTLLDEVPGVDHTTRVLGLAGPEQLGPLLELEDPQEQELELVGVTQA